MLSADTSTFNKKSAVTKRFVFVGRFVPAKGLNLLLDAYDSLPEKVKAEWPMVLIGDGELRDDIEKRASSHIIIKPFLQLDALIDELMQGGVACITSYHDQWGVAIHEMALIGYPLVLSSACGAATEFLISGYNGFLFRKGNVESLREALLRISELSAQELEAFSTRSHSLGRRITSDLVAHSLLSVLPLARI